MICAFSVLQRCPESNVKPASSAFTARGLLTDAAAGDVILAKGMLTVGKHMDQALTLRKSCVKIRFRPTADFATSFRPGINVVQTTEVPQGSPKLNAQLCAALGLRTCLMPGRVHRLAARAELRALCKLGGRRCLSTWKLPLGAFPLQRGLPILALLPSNLRGRLAQCRTLWMPFHRVNIRCTVGITNPARHSFSDMSPTVNHVGEGDSKLAAGRQP